MACSNQKARFDPEQSSNLAFSEWVQVLGDEKLTTALLDRLACRAHILTTSGSSYRMSQRMKEE